MYILPSAYLFIFNFSIIVKKYLVKFITYKIYFCVKYSYFSHIFNIC